MTLPFPLLMLALSATAQEPGPRASAVAPFVGDEVAVVAHIDLAKWPAPENSRRLLGRLADDPDVAGLIDSAEGRLDALKKAGARDLFLLLDPADMPGFPLAVVPMAGGAEARAIAEALSGVGAGRPIRWPAAETIRGAVVAGTPAALARVREARPSARPELAAALAEGGPAAIRLAILPSLAQRRALEEAMPALPPEVGGGAVTGLTRGMTWASVALRTEPGPALRVVVRARDADAARALGTIARDALEALVKASRSSPEFADLADFIARLKPEATGDRVTLEAGVEKAAALVAVPVRQALEAVRRPQCVRNLLQINLAMHNYHSTHNTFPPAYLASKDGKPLLSWRVLVLPFLEQQELFDQFHLDEPWDGPHNRTLISRMPAVYACPSGGRALATEGKTAYLTPRGPTSLFPGAAGIKIQDVTDGTSNTIMVVDAGDDLAVTWTRPDDWEVVPQFRTRGLFGHHPRGTNFGLADGSVRFLKETITPKLLQALITRDGGEVLSADDY